MHLHIVCQVLFTHIFLEYTGRAHPLPGGPTQVVEVPQQPEHRIDFVYNDTPHIVYRDPKHTIYRLIHRVKVYVLKSYC